MTAPGVRRWDERGLRVSFALLLVARLVLPWFDSPLAHLFSDPQRHWDNGALFMHPNIMGANDPFLYQLWLYLVRRLAGGSEAPVLLATGLLCAAMPYGWYRALRERLPRTPALLGGIVIGLAPETLSLYGYFMNETLLITLLGWCVWATWRAARKGSLSAFALAVALWGAAALTRTVAVPMATLCVLWLVWRSRQRLARSFAALVVLAPLLTGAAWHAYGVLGFVTPFGNLYFNRIYSVSGARDIAIDYGPQGQFRFGCPSFYNPTFAPFSTWTTSRTGVVHVVIDTRHGRADWRGELERVAAERRFPWWRQRLEESAYLLFGQLWPNSDLRTGLGLATWATRWVWAPLIGWVVWALRRRRLVGPDWLLPVGAFGTLLLLAAQSAGVMEARFREPLDALFIASAVLLVYRGSHGASHNDIDYREGRT